MTFEDHSHPSANSTTDSNELGLIWKPGYFRLFLSHKSDYKKESTNLKHHLDRLGVAAFVAHEDIEPTKDWLNEIEKALFSMDALVALMTDKFRDSNWTDQEVGVAYGRRVPIIPVRIGTDPYGFIGQFQALSGTGKEMSQLAEDIFNVLWKNDIPATKQRLTEGIVSKFEQSGSWNESNKLMDYVDRIDTAPPEIIARLELAPERNYEIKEAFAVKERLPALIKKLKGS